jgi:hypothetical protein
VTMVRKGGTIGGLNVGPWGEKVGLRGLNV